MEEYAYDPWRFKDSKAVVHLVQKRTNLRNEIDRNTVHFLSLQNVSRQKAIALTINLKTLSISKAHLSSMVPTEGPRYYFIFPCNGQLTLNGSEIAIVSKDAILTLDLEKPITQVKQQLLAENFLLFN